MRKENEHIASAAAQKEAKAEEQLDNWEILIAH